MTAAVVFALTRFFMIEYIIKCFEFFPPKTDLLDGEDIARCATCSLILRVIYNVVCCCHHPCTHTSSKPQDALPTPSTSARTEKITS